MDLLLRNLRIADGPGEAATDIGIADGRIVAITPGIDADCETLDMAGRLAVPGFVESHIHLDKACILDRCTLAEGTLGEAIREVAAAKRGFTVEDVYARGARVLEKCVLNGTQRMRAHTEVDPVVGLTSIEAVLALAEAWRWAIDLEICVFPQDGMLDLPGTEELMVASLKRGARIVGGCPYTDSDPAAQIDRVFEIARDFDVDIDFHLDFDVDPDGATLFHVCDNAVRHGWGGRVAIGHVSKLSAMPPDRLAEAAQRMADAGVALTVLPATDLFLMGSGRDHDIVRGVAPIHRVAGHGVTCALSTNNVLNPFTPFGDGSMMRMANLYANIAQLGTRDAHRACLDYVTANPARLMRLDDYGIAVGAPADIVVLDCGSAEAAVREIAPALCGFKAGRRTFTRPSAELHRP